MSTGDETQAAPRPSLPPRRPSGAGEGDGFDRAYDHDPDAEFGAHPLDRFAASPPPEFPPDQGGATAGRPQILAPQANEWADSMQEVEVVRSRRTGLILLFLLALLAVAVIALGLAALSVFNDGDDLPADGGVATGDTTDTTVTDTSSTTETSVTTTTIDPNALQVVVTEEPFICDGETRQFAQLSGAAPNEQVAFTSPQSDGILPGTADADGVLPIRWQCNPEQAGTVWELTATGETSGKTVTFIFAGAVSAPDSSGSTSSSTPASSTPSTPGALTVNLVENPFSCNGETRIFGGLSGADPNEEVAFSSPQSSGLRSGNADAEGNLPIRWQCTPDQVGTTWELTATGVTSGRTVTFTFTGG